MEQLKEREADITPWKEATNRGPEELLANLESLEVARMSCAVIRARARAYLPSTLLCTAYNVEVLCCFCARRMSL